MSFDGYAVWGDARCRRMANAWNETWRATSSLPETMTELRGCLFFEQRRHNHMSPDYEDGQFEYEAALRERLRSLLKSGVADGEAETTASWLALNPDPGAYGACSTKLSETPLSRSVTRLPPAIAPTVLRRTFAAG